MSSLNSKTSEAALVIYGLGGVGRQIVDELLDEGHSIEFILDRGKRGEEYRGIPIWSLEDMADGKLAGKSVLIGLHNHYVDVNQLHAELLETGASTVLTPTNLPELLVQPRTRPDYWLDFDYDYAAHRLQFERLSQLLADGRSRELLDQILHYRSSGDLAHCPVPSLADEYTPVDLPRFASPLQMIDCGAFTGVAIHKFLKAGYEIDSFVAFEPDEANFKTLASRNFPVRRSLCMPLGTWSSTTQLRFASDQSIGARSHLSDDGNVTIQCVAIDDVVHGETVNLVKLDVEGAEIETLKGMERLIREQRPNLLVSAYHTPGHLHEIVELVDGWQLGYRFHMRVHEYNTFGVVFYCLQDKLVEARIENMSIDTGHPIDLLQVSREK
jgi:FkbM family methyltransferase